MAPGLALLLGLTLAADPFSLEAGVRAEVRGQRFDQDGQPADTWVSLVATPWVALVLIQPEFRGRATYEPRLTLPRVDASLRPDVVHQLRLEARARLRPSLQLDAAASGAYGSSSPVDDARQVRAAGDPSQEPVVSTAVLWSQYAQAELRLAWRADRRTTVTGTATWSRSGGADAASRDAMPPEETWRLDAAALRQASRVDELELGVGLSDTRFDAGGGATFGLVTASWRRRLRPGTSAWARAGAGGSFAEPAGREAVQRPVFAAELGVAQAAVLHDLAGQLALRALPVVDRLLGTVDARFEAEASAALAIGSDWRLVARATGALFQREGGDARLLLADLRLERSLGRHLTVGAGAYVTRQVSASPDLPTFSEGGLRVGLEWRTTSRPERGDE